MPVITAFQHAITLSLEEGKMIALLTMLALTLPATALQTRLEGQELVDYLNKKQSLFKAALPKLSYAEFKSRLMDSKYFQHDKKYAKEAETNEDIPESFDAREQWPECDSIRLIRDQANCKLGSWAVVSASTMSDRLCVQSNGKLKALVSDTDILACCGDLCGDGCNGGYIDMAWEYVMKNGSCTGGLYRQKGVCKPYAFHPCGKHKDQPYYGECPDKEETPACRQKCQHTYGKTYEKDKIYALSRYNVKEDEIAIQKEIMKNGPVQSAFIVYSDFLHYSKGIYKYTWGVQEGLHAVKLIGWGVENGTKYWLIANCWNSDWGEDGYFRILRGTDECYLESWVYAGMMKVELY